MYSHSVGPRFEPVKTIIVEELLTPAMPVAVHNYLALTFSTRRYVGKIWQTGRWKAADSRSALNHRGLRNHIDSSGKMGRNRIAGVRRLHADGLEIDGDRCATSE